MTPLFSRARTAFRKSGLGALCALMIAGLFAFDAAAQNPQTQKLFNAETFTLDNGLEIVVIPNHRTPVVTHMVWYKVGAADEPPGQSGIAHFLEHLMFKGTVCTTPGAFSHIIRGLGGNDNAFTGNDYTAYFQSIAAEHLTTVMRMEADRMRGLSLREEDVASELKVIIEERRQRTDNNPQTRFGDQIGAALYVNHPYSKPVIGWPAEMSVLTHQNAVDFYRNWYAPNNAILIVAGDVTGEQVYALAKDIYGTIKRGPDMPARARTKPPRGEGDLTFIMRDKTVREAVVQKTYRVPSFRQSKQDSLALQVLENILSGGPTSRLYQSLVVKQKLAVDAGLSYHSATWDDAELAFYALPAPGQSPERLAMALTAEVQFLIERGVPETELQEAIKRMRASAVLALDSLSGPAMIFGQSLTTGSNIDDLEYWGNDIAAVTAEDVVRVAKTYLDKDAPANRPVIYSFMLPDDSGEKDKAP